MAGSWRPLGSLGKLFLDTAGTLDAGVLSDYALPKLFGLIIKPQVDAWRSQSCAAIS